jgi:histidinol-phosphate phosphatase family protein
MTNQRTNGGKRENQSGEPVQTSAVPSEIVRLLFSTPDASAARPAIFLDRDGIINEKIEGGYVTEWSSFQMIPGIRETVRALSGLGLPIVIVSNQACVGKALLTGRHLAQITRRFVEELRRDGARIDAAYYCPHTVEADCRCRKPRPGLLQEAARDWGADLRRSVFVGDSATDLEAATAVGCKAILFSKSAPAAGKRPQEDTLQVSNPDEIYAAVSRLLGLGVSDPDSPQPFDFQQLEVFPVPER